MAALAPKKINSDASLQQDEAFSVGYWQQPEQQPKLQQQ